MAQRLIDVNGIVAVADHAYDAWNLAMATADGKREINLIYKRQELCKAVKAVAENCPTVDAVEVVRCKDCKHFKKWKNAFGVEGFKCHLLCADVEPGNFCCWGERRDDG